MATRIPLLIAVVSAVLSLHACNCGRQNVTKTEASLSLPLEVLDFGVVPEGTSKGLRFQIDNVGRAPVNITASIVAGGSMDFRLGAVPPTVDPTGFVEVPVLFTPVGAGVDEATIQIKTDKADELPLTLLLKGGPIAPQLTFDPDPLSFVGATGLLETKTAQLKSTGTAALTIRSVGVAATGNPDFSVSPPMTPLKIMPGDIAAVTVEYSRMPNNVSEGLMEVLSDDPDGGLKRLRLIPHMPTACSNLLDDDNDGVADFPDDPGCQDLADNDEYNPAQCVNMAVQRCDAGVCLGSRTCTNGTWGRCGGCDAGVPPVDAGQPVDAGACTVTGTWRIDGGPLEYRCCNLFGFGSYAVNVNINQFSINPATTVRPQPSQPGSTLTQSPAPTCGGNFSYSRTISGGCTEVFTLSGTFTAPNRFVGTYDIAFSGSQCVGDPQCGNEDCFDQTFPVEAYR
ncbi:MAG: choice-of-anchor D domain-containing protein [Myxococcaceae bacterium]|nr:choice-of-anchor D domain-containing protein [Myxococcaceae bacterium]